MTLFINSDVGFRIFDQHLELLQFVFPPLAGGILIIIHVRRFCAIQFIKPAQFSDMASRGQTCLKEPQKRNRQNEAEQVAERPVPVVVKQTPQDGGKN